MRAIYQKKTTPKIAIKILDEIMTAPGKMHFIISITSHRYHTGMNFKNRFVTTQSDMGQI